jgi:hypothetical protein
VRKGTLPKDAIEKLKQIEKTSEERAGASKSIGQQSMRTQNQEKLSRSLWRCDFAVGRPRPHDFGIA